MPVVPERVYLVMADWCPHCAPMSTERGARLAQRLAVPLVTLDIDDPDQERQADALVARFGDWTDDYLIPQVFLQWSDGRIEHLLTGVPGNPEGGTRARWDAVFARFEVPEPRSPD